MDLKQLRYIIAIAQEKNITKAAEKLFISQSSLSYTISMVEKEIGKPLFIRRKNGVDLTPAGEKYYEAALSITSIYDNMIRELRHNEKEMKINIAASSVWGRKLFSELIPLFRRKHPNVSFTLTQAEMFYLDAELKDEAIDFAFLSLSPFDRLTGHMRILRSEPLLLAIPVGHPYAEENDGSIISREDFMRWFADDTFLLSRIGSSNRKVAEHLFEEYHFQPATILEVNGIDLTRTMVATGEDVAFIPLSGCEPNDQVHYYHFDPEICRYNVLFSRSSFRSDPVKRSFYEFVLEYMESNGSFSNLLGS